MEHSKLILEACGFRLGYRVPFHLVYCVVFVLELLLTLLSPLVKINLPTSISMLNYINHNYSYRRDRAAQELDYHPLFTYQQAKDHSTQYYSKMKT